MNPEDNQQNTPTALDPKRMAKSHQPFSPRRFMHLKQPADNPNTPQPPVALPAVDAIVQTPVTPPPKKQHRRPRPHKRATLLVSLAGVFLISISLIAYVTILGPAASAKRAATSFMEATTGGNLEKLFRDRNIDDELSKEFVLDISGSLLGDYELLDQTSTATKWHFLYALIDSEAEYARITVEKQKSGWQVSSVTLSRDELSLKPNYENTNQTAVSSAELTCLSQQDYSFMTFDQSVPTIDYVTIDEYGFFAERTDSVIFKPDTTEETILGSYYDRWAEFSAGNPDKAWYLEVSGVTFGAGGNSSADFISAKLASDRVNEVKRELASRGIHSDRIKDGDSINIQAQYSNEGIESEIFRKVNVTIKNPCIEKELAPGSKISL